MDMRIFYLQVLLLLISVFSPVTQATEDRVYTFGVVPQYASHRIRAIWDPILREIEKRTGLKFRLVGSPSIPVFAGEVLDGRFDFSYMNPYHIIMAHQAQGYNPLVRDHGRKLHGILVVHKDGPIHSIKDLQGKQIAFPSPDALGASLLIRAELARHYHIQFEAFYVNTHSSVYLNVALQQTAAGGGVQKTLQQQKPAIRNRLKILYRTEDVTPHPIAVHPRIPTAIREKVQQAFIQMATTEQGKTLLSRIPMKQLGPATLQDYDALRKLKLKEFLGKEKP